ncbi:MAG TPA: PhzF family phenazine biosynthesis protein [Syntrophorhabdaceae bacterium]|jgi:PhzF family phenazine biosynthesis protein
MKIDFFQVDAFTRQVFGGNPAAVCILDSWCEDGLLQHIASEHNLSETAFLVPISKGRYGLRWFTPAMEVDLCGHATLASAFVVFSFLESALSSVYFETASGSLTVVRAGDLFSMDFPSRPPASAKGVPLLCEALGAAPDEVWKARDFMAVFSEESIIRKMKPDFSRLGEITDTLGIIVTAPGERCDFVSRFFAPKVGVNEDPVTGSAHSTLIPYWGQRFNKKDLHALQLSARGGELFCENRGERVGIAGHAVLYAKGHIFL